MPRDSALCLMREGFDSTLWATSKSLPSVRAVSMFCSMALVSRAQAAVAEVMATRATAMRATATSTQAASFARARAPAGSPTGSGRTPRPGTTEMEGSA